jgi:hypothetical protein
MMYEPLFSLLDLLIFIGANTLGCYWIMLHSTAPSCKKDKESGRPPQDPQV